MRTATQLRALAPRARPRVSVAVSYLMSLIVRPAPIPERRSINQIGARQASAGYAAPPEKKTHTPDDQIGNLKTNAPSNSR